MKYNNRSASIYITVCLLGLTGSTKSQSIIADKKPTTQSRKALLIGNRLYKNVITLKNTERDVDSMASVLRKIGFVVTAYKNLDYRSSVEAMEDFTGKLKPNDISLVYYSGHGIGYNGNNYLLPIDINIKCTEQLSAYTPVSLNKIMSDILVQSVQVSFVILDACRDLPLVNECTSAKNIQTSKGLIKPSYLPPGSLVAFATSEGNTADDDTYDQQNSLFTSELIKYLARPNIGIRQILDSTRRKVLSRSARKQNPQRIDDLFSDYVFTQVSNGEKLVTVPTYNPSNVNTENPVVRKRMIVVAYKPNSKEIDHEVARVAAIELKNKFSDYDITSQSGSKSISPDEMICTLTRKTSFRTVQTVGVSHIVADTELLIIFQQNGQIVDQQTLIEGGTDSDKHRAELASVERALTHLIK